jgi:hypothetical protein
MLPDRNLQTEIGGGPNIRPSQRKEQVDFGAPPPDTSDRQELGERGLVIRRGKPNEIERAAGDHLGEMARISHFLSAEAARAVRRVIEGEEPLRHQRVAQPNKPLVHRCGGVDRHLLLENYVQKRAEPVAAAAKLRRPRTLQDRGEKRLGSENGNPFGEALRRIDRSLELRRVSAHGVASATTTNRSAASHHRFARAFHSDAPSISIRLFAGSVLMA